MDSDEKINLPKLKYKIGTEPSQKCVISTLCSSKIVTFVKQKVTNNVWNRIERSFMGPILRTITRDKVQIAVKLIHLILSRNIMVKKDKELWFHFDGKPMRFSIREFRQITGLKCKAEEIVESSNSREGEKEFDWPQLNGVKHTMDDLKKILPTISVVNEDEQYAFAMLMLIEAILFANFPTTKFEDQNVKRAKRLRDLENYEWGKDSYLFLLKSLKNSTEKHLELSRANIPGLLVVFNIWILESIPRIRNLFSEFERTTETFLCERYIELDSPEPKILKRMEEHDKGVVYTFLNPLNFDLENNSLSLEDNEDNDLDRLLDLVKQGYRVSQEDWENGFIEISKANEFIATLGREDHVQSFHYASINEKIEKIQAMIVQNLDVTRQKVGKLEDHMDLITKSLVRLYQFFLTHVSN